MNNPHKIPLWLKIAYSVFMSILIPAYWYVYGPVNFLWFSDIAAILLILALWLENSLICSMCGLSVIVFELSWCLDFFVRILTRWHPFNVTQYMFDTTIPLFIRSLSLFHIILPFLLLWLLYKLGYDRRAFIAQTILAWLVLLTIYLLHPVGNNINGVFGIVRNPQPLNNPILYLMVLMLLYPIGIYLPSHLLFKKIFYRPHN